MPANVQAAEAARAWKAAIDARQAAWADFEAPTGRSSMCSRRRRNVNAVAAKSFQTFRGNPCNGLDQERRHRTDALG